VDDAREVTSEQATAYQPTGKKMRPPGSKRSAAAAVTATKDRITLSQKAAEDKATEQSTAQTTAPARIYIRMLDSQNHALLASLKQCLEESRGTTEVVLVLGPTDSKQIIKLPMSIESSSMVLEKLRTLVGSDNIKLQ